VAALRDDNEDVRSQAARALGALGQADAAVIPALVAALRDDNEDVRFHAAGALGKLWKKQPVLFLFNEFQNPMSGYRTAAVHALVVKDSILQDSITLKKIDEFRAQDKRPWVRLAAWKAYELIQEKRKQVEKGQKNYVKAQKNIHQADSLFTAGNYFYARKNYYNAFNNISEKSREDSLKAGKVKFNESRCTVLLKRPGQTIRNLKTAFAYAPAYKDTLQAALQRGDKEWAIIKDNWYLNQVLLRKKSPPKK
jgi:tetratricopeptide (TPR) repeat protein